MEHSKELPHNSKKTFDACLLCFYEAYACKKCTELCIFSKVFVEKASSNKRLRTSLKSKYYKEEFDYIRNFNPEPQELKQDKKHKKFKAREIEEHFSDDDKDEVEFELIQKFRKNPHDYLEIIKNHNIKEFDKGRVSFHNKCGIVNGKTEIKGRCTVHRSATQGKYERSLGLRYNKGYSRQSIRIDLVKFSQGPAINYN